MYIGSASFQMMEVNFRGLRLDPLVAAGDRSCELVGLLCVGAGERSCKLGDFEVPAGFENLACKLGDLACKLGDFEVPAGDCAFLLAIIFIIGDLDTIGDIFLLGVLEFFNRVISTFALMIFTAFLALELSLA